MIFAMGMCLGHFLQGRKYGHLGPVSDILEWIDAWKVLYLDKRYVTNMVDALSGSNIGMSLHVASVTVLVYAIGAANRTPVGKGLMHRVVIFPCLCQKCTHCIDDFMCEMKADDYDKKFAKSVVCGQCPFLLKTQDIAT